MKIFGFLAFAAFMLLGVQPAAAQFAGQPSWLSDPTGVCSYPGRAGCPLVTAREPFPNAATSVTAASGSVAAATAAASMPAVAAKTNYLTHIDITGGGATSASVVACTVAGLIGGTQTILIPVPAGATLGIVPFVSNYSAAPAAASAVNTAITVSCPTFGSGNTAASVNVSGYVR